MTEPSFESLFTSAFSVLKAVDIQAQQAVQVPRPVRNSIRFSVELSGYKAWFVRVEKSSLSQLQVARLIYMRFAGKLLIGEVDGLLILVGNPACTDLTALLSPAHFENTVLVQVSEADHIWPEAMKRIVQLSIVFELCRTHGWITIGSDLTTLSIADIINTPFRHGEKPHRNVPVLSFLELEGSHIEVKMQVNKYYPLSVGELIANKEPSFNVVVLPNLTEGICSIQRPSSKWNTESLMQYWKTHHGYLLSHESAHRTVGVSLPSSGFELTYPATCVWKHKWNYVPSHTREYMPKMEDRMISELQQIALEWSQEGRLGVCVNRDGMPLINHQRSVVPCESTNTAKTRPFVDPGPSTRCKKTRK